jgi:carbamate kinase
VVPSPPPIRIVEAAAIRSLVDSGVLVVASGGGGVPVVELPDGRYEGVEAVIDKDLAAVVLARAVDADGLLLLSDVDAVYRRWGTPRQEPILRLSVEEAMEGLASGIVAVGLDGAQGSRLRSSSPAAAGSPPSAPSRTPWRSSKAAPGPGSAQGRACRRCTIFRTASVSWARSGWFPGAVVAE